MAGVGVKDLMAEVEAVAADFDAGRMERAKVGALLAIAKALALLANAVDNAGYFNVHVDQVDTWWEKEVYGGIR